jgi:hypothetical protein
MGDTKAELLPKPGKKDVRLLKGIIRSSNRRAVTLGEMNQAIAACAARRPDKTPGITPTGLSEKP